MDSLLELKDILERIATVEMSPEYAKRVLELNRETQKEIFRHKTIRVLHVVEPKTGCNMLRAGSSAYDKAVVANTNPVILLSLDGKHQWRDLNIDLFVPIGEVAVDTFQHLRHGNAVDEITFTKIIPGLEIIYQEHSLEKGQ